MIWQAHIEPVFFLNQEITKQNSIFYDELLDKINFINIT